MESANSHHHHHHLLQDQLVGSSASSSSAATPSYYGEGTTPHAWSTTTPTSFLNTNNGFTLYTSEPILNSRSEPRPQENTLLSSQYSSNMVPDLGFHNWANATNNFTASQSVHNFQLPRTKDEISDHYYRKYADILSSNEPKILMNKNMSQLSSGDLPYASNTGRGFSQIFPSINVSDLSHQMGLANASGSLDMNLEALDLLTSSSFSGNLGTSSSSQNQIGILRDGFSNYGAFDEHMPQSNHIPLYASNKISSSPVSMGAVESKRSSGKMEPKAPLQNAMKKSRVEARASCPPFKVRKEKLGDRIAALQQMVAPFGKTDTASVLMEAIGYIKFLQDQVETLSVPYMKASRNKSGRVIKTGHADQNEMEEPKRDLKSRGLCLVPLSCLSYIDDGGGAAVWPPPHFGGAN